MSMRKIIYTVYIYQRKLKTFRQAVLKMDLTCFQKLPLTAK